MNQVCKAVCVSALCIAGDAIALPLDAFWVEVPVVDDPSDSEDLTGFRSFDLFVTLETGDVVFAQDFGIAGPNVGIGLGAGQVFFHHPFGTDKASNPLLVDVFPDLTFDTRGQMGVLGWDEYSLPIGPINWESGGADGGFWGVNVPEPGEAPPDANGHYWFARITVTSIGAFGEMTSGFGEFLGGELFISGIGPNGNFGQQFPPNGVVTIPNAFDVPAPGTVVTLGLISVGMLRRRRN